MTQFPESAVALLQGDAALGVGVDGIGYFVHTLSFQFGFYSA